MWSLGDFLIHLWLMEEGLLVSEGWPTVMKLSAATRPAWPWHIAQNYCNWPLSEAINCPRLTCWAQSHGPRGKNIIILSDETHTSLFIIGFPLLLPKHSH